MKILKNIKILLSAMAMIPVLLPAQETVIDCCMPLSNAVSLYNEIPIEPPIAGKADTLLRNYIPYFYQFSLEVNVNLFFLQKDNGTGNFQEDNEEHQRLWDEILSGLSDRFTDIKDSELDSCFAWRDPFISDSRIRLKFNRHYIKNSTYWNWKLHGETAFGIGSVLDNTLKRELENRNDIPLGISIFFPENGDVFDEYMDVIVSGNTVSSKTVDYAYASFPGTNYISKVCMPDIYCTFLWLKYIAPRNRTLSGIAKSWENGGWNTMVNTMIRGLAHELGHAFHLDHACNHYGLNYCRDAIMAQSGKLHYSRTYIPPTEIGKMHKALMETKLKELIPKTIPLVGTMNVTHELNWNAPFRCYADLAIARQGKVDMNGNVQMPKKSKIEVSGQLYVRNGGVECVDGTDHWMGIRVKSGGLLWLENATIGDHDIIMETGSTLVLRGTITFKNGHNLVLDNGVYVCAADNFSCATSSFCVNGTPSSVLKNGIAPGITPKYASPCGTTGRQRFLTKCSVMQDTLYVQNQTISQNQTFVAKKILVGNAVDANRVKGDVVIKSPARATFICKDRILFDKGFRCESAGYQVLRF
ncbi:MAG: hypothetical protein NC324_01590 [Bacteroides sp.]|nr:hypothetical protein [Bacteroides sp.]